MTQILHVPTSQELWRIDLAILEHFFDAQRELDEDSDQIFLNATLFQFDERLKGYYLLAQTERTVVYFTLAEQFNHPYFNFYSAQERLHFQC